MSVRSGSSMSHGDSGYTPSDAALTPGGTSLTPKQGSSSDGGGGGGRLGSAAAAANSNSRSNNSNGGALDALAQSPYNIPPGFSSTVKGGKRRSYGEGGDENRPHTGNIPRPPPQTGGGKSGGGRGGGGRLGTAGSRGRGSSAGQQRASSARGPSSSRIRLGATSSAASSAARAKAQLLLPALDPGVTASNKHGAQSLVAQLDSERRRHEIEGRFLEAQDCLDTMRALTNEQGKQIILEAVKRNEAGDARQQLLDEHRRQVFQFTKLWEDTMQEYEIKAEKHIGEVQERQRREFEEFEELIRSELASKKNPHFSKAVLHARQELQKLVELKRYKEANTVQKQVEAAEAAETRQFEEELSLKFASKTRQLKKKNMLELKTLRQKISQERDSLLHQRRSNYETLIQRHLNAVSAFDQKARTGAARDRKALSRQLEAMVSCPTKTTLEALTNQ